MPDPSDGGAPGADLTLPPIPPSDQPGADEPSGDDLVPDDHDPNATLEEEAPTPPETPTDSQRIPQVTKDAENLAAKWESLSDTEKDQKVATLFNTRKPVLDALAKKLGTTTKELLDKHTEAPPAPAFDKEEILAEATKRATTKLREELSPALIQADNAWAQAEITKWGEHNKLTPEEISELNNPDSEVRKRFNEMKFDPSTGEELTRKGRLKLALANSSELQQKLIDRKIIKGAHALHKAVKGKIPSSGGSPGSSTIKSVLSDPNTSDADFLKTLNQGGAKLVGQD